MMNLKNQLKGIFVLLTIFSIAFVACNKDDDGATDACIDVTELSACVDCCQNSGFEGAEFDLITETCECTNDFDDDFSDDNANASVCQGQVGNENACSTCCSDAGFVGYIWGGFGDCGCL